jgi:hypothetical protein
MTISRQARTRMWPRLRASASLVYLAVCLHVRNPLFDEGSRTIHVFRLRRVFQRLERTSEKSNRLIYRETCRKRLLWYIVNLFRGHNFVAPTLNSFLKAFPVFWPARSEQAGKIAGLWVHGFFVLMVHFFRAKQSSAEYPCRRRHRIFRVIRGGSGDRASRRRTSRFARGELFQPWRVFPWPF